MSGWLLRRCAAAPRRSPARWSRWPRGPPSRHPAGCTGRCPGCWTHRPPDRSSGSGRRRRSADPSPTRTPRCCGGRGDPLLATGARSAGAGSAGPGDRRPDRRCPCPAGGDRRGRAAAGSRHRAGRGPRRHRRSAGKRPGRAAGSVAAGGRRRMGIGTARRADRADRTGRRAARHSARLRHPRAAAGRHGHRSDGGHRPAGAGPQRARAGHRPGRVPAPPRRPDGGHPCSRAAPSRPARGKPRRGRRLLLRSCHPAFRPVTPAPAGVAGGCPALGCRVMAQDIVPIELGLTAGDFVTLWAPRWREDGEEWEAFLGDGDDLFAFPDVASMVAFVRTAREHDLADHPAWSAVPQLAAPDLMPEETQSYDLVGVPELVAEDPDTWNIAELAEIVSMARSLADVCELDVVHEVLDSAAGFSMLDGGTLPFGGREGARLWAAMSTAVAERWDEVLDALDAVINTPQVDAAAVAAAQTELAEAEADEVIEAEADEVIEAGDDAEEVEVVAVG